MLLQKKLNNLGVNSFVPKNEKEMDIMIATERINAVIINPFIHPSFLKDLSASIGNKYLNSGLCLLKRIKEQTHCFRVKLIVYTYVPIEKLLKNNFPDENEGGYEYFSILPNLKIENLSESILSA